MNEGLALDQVSFRRRGFHLAAVTVAVGVGEVLHVLGVNGSGKSTLLALIAGLLPIGGGRICFRQQLLSAPSEHLAPWLRPCAMLLQEPGLWPHLSVADQCRLVARGREEARKPGGDGAGSDGTGSDGTGSDGTGSDGTGSDGTGSDGTGADDERLQRWADLLGVRHLLERRPADLSGGEAQRCALVRTLMIRAPLVLLDEPYSAQHSDGVDRIDAVISTLVADGCVIVVAGHRTPPGARSFELT